MGNSQNVVFFFLFLCVKILLRFTEYLPSLDSIVLIDSEKSGCDLPFFDIRLRNPKK